MIQCGLQQHLFGCCPFGLTDKMFYLNLRLNVDTMVNFIELIPYDGK